MEQQNTQLLFRQLMNRSRGLFCLCESGVARGQSHLYCHFWGRVHCLKGISCTSQLSSYQLYFCWSCGFEWLQKSKDSLKVCFENGNL